MTAAHAAYRVGAGAWRARSDARGAVVAVWLDVYEFPMADAEDTGLQGPNLGPQDAYRHCLASCVATGHFSSGFAQWLGDFNERGNDPDDPDTKMDAHNNDVGRCLGELLAGLMLQ